MSPYRLHVPLVRQFIKVILPTQSSLLYLALEVPDQPLILCASACSPLSLGHVSGPIKAPGLLTPT